MFNKNPKHSAILDWALSMADYLKAIDEKDKITITFKLPLSIINYIYEWSNSADVSPSTYAGYLVGVSHHLVEKFKDSVEKERGEHKATKEKLEAIIAEQQAQIELLKQKVQSNSKVEKIVELSASTNVDESGVADTKDIPSKLIHEHYDNIIQTLSYTLGKYSGNNFGFPKDLQVLCTDQVKQILIVDGYEFARLRDLYLLHPIKSPIQELRKYNFYKAKDVLKPLYDRRKEIESILYKQLLSETKQLAEEEINPY